MAAASFNFDLSWGSKKRRSQYPLQYQCILRAIHKFVHLQSDGPLSFSRDEAAQTITRVVYMDNNRILQSIRIFETLQETRQISVGKTLWFLIGEWISRTPSRAMKAEFNAAQQKLIMDQEDEESTRARLLRIKRKDYDLVCTVCQEVFTDYRDFGCHVVEHIKARRVHRCQKCRRPAHFYGHTYCRGIEY